VLKQIITLFLSGRKCWAYSSLLLILKKKITHLFILQLLFL